LPQGWPIACLIQVAYAIGVADPMSLYVDTQGTGKVDERKLEKVLSDIFPLRPTNIRRGLQLNKPIYQRRRLRPFWPQAGQGWRLLLGAARPRAGAEAGLRSHVKIDL
jgi:hypothetical protein